MTFRHDPIIAMTKEDLDEISGLWVGAYGSLEGEDGGWSMRAIARLLDEVRSHAVGLCYVLWPGGPNGEQLACGHRRFHEGNHSWAWVPTVTQEPRVEEPRPPEGDYLSAREQLRLMCSCGCRLRDHSEYGCSPHGRHAFTRTGQP